MTLREKHFKSKGYYKTLSNALMIEEARIAGLTNPLALVLADRLEETCHPTLFHHMGGDDD
jgi:hypothetical protein